MNMCRLVESIQKTSHAITVHQQRISASAYAIQTAFTPAEPYVYFMPVVAFFVGLRYAKPCAQLVSLPYLRTYSMLLLPLLKE